MKKVILITGATDGIGLATAEKLVLEGHTVLIHGRNANKINRVKNQLSNLSKAGIVKGYLADLSSFKAIERLVDHIKTQHENLNVIINNAGVYKAEKTITPDGLDVRFVVNTIAPYKLTKSLLPLLSRGSRVINLSSAAQAPVNIEALQGKVKLVDMEAYAQSKLAITMWSSTVAKAFVEKGITVIAVNPGSMLGSKMVTEGFGVSGGDLSIGANILTQIAIDDGMEAHSGQYFDNDLGHFVAPHPDGLNGEKCQEIVDTLEEILAS